MKKRTIRITALALVVITAFGLMACSSKSTVAKTYQVDEVKQKLIEVLGLDQNEVKVEDLDNGTLISYGDWSTWFDCYIVDDSKGALEYFDLQTLAGTFDAKNAKRVNKKEHKVWVEEIEGSLEEPVLYTVLAMKGNLVLSVTSPVEYDKIIKAFELD